jgi:hypothetical protein
MPFTGTPDVIAFKEKFNRVLAANEIEGRSPYALYWAGTAKSGYSFGVPQWDLAQGKSTTNNRFLDILLNAKDSSGNYIVDDGNPNTGRGTAANIEDTLVRDLFARAKLKGGTSLSASEVALISAALSSAYGVAAMPPTRRKASGSRLIASACLSVASSSSVRPNFWYTAASAKRGSAFPGFERTLAYVTGLLNVRDAIPFPRTPGSATY